MEPRHPSALDDFLFDLNGYVIIKNAVEPELLDELNAAFDTFPPLEYGEWWGNAQRRDYTKDTGLELHNCVEAGAPFERLIDHPGWINYVRHYCGEEQSYVTGLVHRRVHRHRFVAAAAITRCIPAAIGARCAARTTTRMACFAAASATSSWR